MISCEDWLGGAASLGVEYFAGVPCSALEPLCSVIHTRVPASNHLLAADEGGAVAWAMGVALATGTTPLVYLQNSGLGHALNPLASLAHREVYGIAMVLLVGWRGAPGYSDEPQHRVHGRATEALFEAVGISTEVLRPELEAALAQLESALTKAQESSQPVALLASARTFGPSMSSHPPPGFFTRERAIRSILDSLPEDVVVVATTGQTARELAVIRHETGRSGDADLLVVGGMGHASMIALGIAERHPQRLVCCLDGDGAALMHLGALPIIGTRAPRNFLHAVLDNGVHDSVGGQPTVARQIDLAAMARACGYRHAETVEDNATVPSVIERILGSGATSTGPALLDLHVERGTRADLPRPLTSPSELSIRLRRIFLTNDADSGDILPRSQRNFSGGPS